ncbi:hypothetical protein H0H92_013627 [Tricholoma furcatifolium]|nr:hypothetical protein H0H92_013627 [Tricholoma furcatifolium]
MASAPSFLTKSRSTAGPGAPKKGTVDRRPAARLTPMSEFSSPQVPHSGWAAENFMLGAGMVIIQPSTEKIVLVRDGDHWFLPRGRKDIGESLETTALREAYEESGYRVEFLPLYIPTRAPPPPSNRAARWEMNTEPVYTTVTHWSAGQGNRQLPGEYITFWYVGQIPHDAIYTSGTGMHDEQGYTSHLCTYDEAMTLLGKTQQDVVYYVWALYLDTLRIQMQEEELIKTERSNNAPQSHDASAPATLEETSQARSDLRTDFPHHHTE